MTSFYMFRLWFKTFTGTERFEEQANSHTHGAAGHAHADGHAVMVADHHDSHAHGVHESPAIMTIPLMILAVLSIIGGVVGIPAAMGGHNEIEHFLEPVFSSGAVAEAATAAGGHGMELGLATVSVLVALFGLAVAWFFYYKKPGTAGAIANGVPVLYRLVLNKFYIDEFYNNIIVGLLLMFTRLGLELGVEGLFVKTSGVAAGATTKGFGSLVRRIQSGNIRSYAGWLAIGAAAVLIVMIFGRFSWLH
jgi:NADH-quinone oxidoreductase subunit L